MTGPVLSIELAHPVPPHPAGVARTADRPLLPLRGTTARLLRPPPARRPARHHGSHAELRPDQLPLVTGLPGLLSLFDGDGAALGTADFLRAWAAHPGFRLLK